MNSVPNLRFSDFKEEWLPKKLSMIFEELKNKTSDTIKYPLYSLTIEAGVVPKSERYEREFLVKKDDDNFKIVEKDNFVYNPMNLRFGALASYKGEKAVSVSGYYNIFKIIDKSPVSFWDNYLKTNRMIYLYNTIATGSLNEKRRVHFSQFIDLKLYIPSLEEQEKIASFFSLIDKKIELQTKKVEELKNYKKGIVQKIFSQELRFKDENGNDYPDWEERKLAELIDKGKAGGTPKSTVLEYYNGDINFLSISDMTTQGKYLTYTEKTITELGLENSSAWIVPKNSLIYSMYASVGFVSINKIELATSQAMFSMIINTKVNLDYVYHYLLYFKDNGIKALIETGTQGNLNANIVKNIILPSPCRREQDKIANCISAIENKIEKEEGKLKMYEDYKKGLLQQMFI